MTQLNEHRLRQGLQQAAGDVAGAGDPQATWQRASHRVAQRRRRRRAASAAAAVLIVGLAAAAALPQILGPGVFDEADIADVDPDPGPADEPAEPEPEDGDVEMATTTCANPDHDVALDYPADWHADEPDCAMFGPDPIDLDEGIGGAAGFEGVHILGDVLAHDFDDQVQGLGGVGVQEMVDLDQRRVDGRRAARWESIASGEAGLPEGTRSIGWVIEVDAERIVVLRTHDANAPERFERDVQVLDAMAESVRPIEAGASG